MYPDSMWICFLHYVLVFCASWKIWVLGLRPFFFTVDILLVSSFLGNRPKNQIQNTEIQITESQNTETQKTEIQNTECQNTESHNTEAICPN